MNISDYIIDQDGFDWQSSLTDYQCLAGMAFTIWIANLFGDLVLINDSGGIVYFDSSAGSCRQLCDRKEAFISWIDVGNNADDVFMIHLADACKSARLKLGKLQCYSFKKPTILGGEFRPDNVYVCDLTVHYGFMGQLCNQIANLPDGTKITVKFQDA